VTEGDFLGPIGNATAKYESSNPVVRRLLNRFLRHVEEAALSLHPSSVLDVGCGEGVVTERLARLLAPAEVLGVDADEGHLKDEWQARTATNLSFTTGSAYELPFADGSFDLVCCMEVLEHLERPRDALDRDQVLYLRPGEAGRGRQLRGRWLAPVRLEVSAPRVLHARELAQRAVG